ncbi:WD40 repeat-like protein [Hesseltinella vesiculosa]|uniref:WD40 repeat-like protein n=1 Tax=Hesseltinella vesiculosa TaxID=101127 RepID=A0A1X2GVR0_9FUNG|nr:WD40 repeat-like protein [Hesseltinella vesiculosa]
MNSLHQVDDLVKEYLLFRGFTGTFRALEVESRTDKDKGFQVDKILEELLSFVTSSDVQSLLDYYRYLDIRFFSRLDSRFQRTAKKFELCLLRHYLVHAIQHKKRDKVKEFFDIYGAELHNTPEWTAWFALPYIKQPATDPTFETFFAKQWVDNYTTSLHNFLATIFQNMPLPSLLTFSVDRTKRKTQQSEIESLRSTVDQLKSSLESSENEVAKLNVELEETRKEMTDGISLIRQRAASIQPGQDTSKESTDDPVVTDTMQDGDSFVVLNQEEYSEHASAITHAQFSTQGTLIASCDMDNIVRIWSYKGQSAAPQKITSSNFNVLSMSWDARSDRFLFLGTDQGMIRVYNVENRSVVQEFGMSEKYPWVTQLSSSPVEPVIVCSASGSKIKQSSKQHGALVAWNLKSLSSSGIFKLDTSDSSEINTINHNHNGQMLVAGDGNGMLRIFDVRTMKSIMEWKTDNARPVCMAQFSFDENSIYTVNNGGCLNQWSIHKPGKQLQAHSLANFPPCTPRTIASQSSITSSSLLKLEPQPSLSSPEFPRPTSNRSSSSRASVSSSRSARLPSFSAEEGVIQSLLAKTPRSQLVAFSDDTNHVLCATQPTSAEGLALAPSNETQGTIFNVHSGQPALRMASQPAYRQITAVDWTNTSNTCLLGCRDGSVNVVNLFHHRTL